MWCEEEMDIAFSFLGLPSLSECHQILESYMLTVVQNQGEDGDSECSHIRKDLDRRVVQNLDGGGDREAKSCIVGRPEKRRRASHTTTAGLVTVAHSALQSGDMLNGSRSCDVPVDGVPTLPPHESSGQGLLDSASGSEAQSLEETRVSEICPAASLADAQQRTFRTVAISSPGGNRYQFSFGQ